MSKSAAEQVVREIAPAKVNLFLHVVGKRPDGYHLLESLIAFASDGDIVTARPAEDLSLTITGTFAGPLQTETDNLVLRAARALGSILDVAPRVSLTLNKALPVAAGVGGGSADAAATIRALCRLWGQQPEDSLLLEIATRLGADVPVCLRSQTAYVSGIGERIQALGLWPAIPAILVNPNVPLSTAAVFKARTGPFSAPDACDQRRLERVGRSSEVIGLLRTLRNDLDAPARRIEPAVAGVLGALQTQDRIALARMSGSGATCFGLFEDDAARDAAARHLAMEYPEWWILPTRLGSPDTAG